MLEGTAWLAKNTWSEQHNVALFHKRPQVVMLVVLTAHFPVPSSVCKVGHVRSAISSVLKTRLALTLNTSILRLWHYRVVPHSWHSLKIRGVKKGKKTTKKTEQGQRSPWKCWDGFFMLDPECPRVIMSTESNLPLSSWAPTPLTMVSV